MTTNGTSANHSSDEDAPRPAANPLTEKKRVKFAKAFPEATSRAELLTVNACKYDTLSGDLFCTRQSIYFSGKMFNRKVKFEISLTNVRQIEKRRYGLIPNAIAILTTETKIKLYDFHHRDTTWDILIGAWRAAVPQADQYIRMAEQGYNDSQHDIGDDLSSFDGTIYQDAVHEESDSDSVGSGVTPSTPSTAKEVKVLSNSPPPVLANPTDKRFFRRSVGELIPLKLTQSDSVESLPQVATAAASTATPTITTTPAIEVEIPLKKDKSDEDIGRLRSPSFSETSKADTSKAEEELSRGTVKKHGFLASHRLSLGGNMKKDSHAPTAPSNTLHPEAVPKVRERTQTQSTSPPRASSPVPSQANIPVTTSEASVELALSGDMKGGIIVMNELFNATVEQLSSILFESSEFMVRLHAKRNNKELKVSSWTSFEANGVREVSYIMPVKIPMSTKTSTTCIESHKILKKEPQVSIMDTVTRTPEVPFGDYFVNCCRYVITAASATQSRVVVSGLVKFLKSTVFKGKIEQTAYDGMKPFYEVYKNETIASLKQGERDSETPVGNVSVTLETTRPVVVETVTDSSKQINGFSLDFIIPGLTLSWYMVSMILVGIVAVLLLWLVISFFASPSPGTSPVANDYAYLRHNLDVENALLQHTYLRGLSVGDMMLQLKELQATVEQLQLQIQTLKESTSQKS